MIELLVFTAVFAVGWYFLMERGRAARSNAPDAAQRAWRRSLATAILAGSLSGLLALLL